MVQNPATDGEKLSIRLKKVILECLQRIIPMSKQETEGNKRGRHWFSNFGHDRQIKSVSLFFQDNAQIFICFKAPDLTAFHKKNAKAWNNLYKGSVLEDLTLDAFIASLNYCL